MLLHFSKSQHILNPFKGLFSWFGRLAVVCAIGVAMLPCLTNAFPLSGGEVILENPKSLEMAKVGGPQELINVSRASNSPDIGIVLQEHNYGEKFVSEIGCGFIKLLPPPSVFAEEVGKPGAEKSTNETKAETFKDFIVQESPLLIGYVLGLLAFGAAYILYFRIEDYLRWRRISRDLPWNKRGRHVKNGRPSKRNVWS